MVLLALLELVALAYFAWLAWKAPLFARVLLNRGYEAKGWTGPRLTARLRLLGIVGSAVALGAIGLAVLKIVA
jgi:hypothetical protein